MIYNGLYMSLGYHIDNWFITGNEGFLNQLMLRELLSRQVSGLFSAYNSLASGSSNTS